MSGSIVRDRLPGSRCQLWSLPFRHCSCFGVSFLLLSSSPLGTRSCNCLLRLEDLRRTSHSIQVYILLPLPFLLIRQPALAILQVLECRQVAALQILRVLQRDDILPPKLVVRHQVAPHLGLDIEPFNRIPRKHIARRSQRHDVRVVRKGLERDGVDVLARIVLGKVQLDQIRALERRSIYGVRAVLLDPWYNRCQVENRPVRGAHRVRERLQRQGAEIEW